MNVKRFASINFSWIVFVELPTLSLCFDLGFVERGKEKKRKKIEKENRVNGASFIYLFFAGLSRCACISHFSKLLMQYM